MIQANELRIGNWISGTMDAEKYPMPLQVVALMNNEVYYRFAEETDKPFSFDRFGEANHSSGNCYGIPLTPEILEKCGFKNTMGDYWVKGKELMLALDKVWWWTNSWEPDGEFGFDTLAQYKEIDYLHQLQNLYYSLTQTEIPITL